MIVPAMKIQVIPTPYRLVTAFLVKQRLPGAAGRSGSYPSPAEIGFKVAKSEAEIVLISRATP